MPTEAETPRDCPVCHCVWDIAGFAKDELTRARTYHIAAFHSYAELLDALDVMWERIRAADAEAEAMVRDAQPRPYDCAGAV